MNDDHHHDRDAQYGDQGTLLIKIIMTIHDDQDNNHNDY